eukprot:scaffold2.g7198.t1
MLVVTEQALTECCSSGAWARQVATGGSYASLDELIATARQAWWHQMPIVGWLEAFAAHPKIGDLERLKAKYGAFADMSKGEQAAAAGASEATLQARAAESPCLAMPAVLRSPRLPPGLRRALQELAEWNSKYEAKFGHIFIICASGKSADEMLAAVKARYPNDPATELQNAAIEQQKITELRLAKVFGGEAAPEPAAPQPQPGARSPITTHVLDTCLGRPAAGVRVSLCRLAPGSAAAWELVAAGNTNQDGRIGDLLPAVGSVQPGSYRITFDTTEYMARCKAAHPTFFADRPFYPAAAVFFDIQPHQAREHFHVPLTWNPFGYSTYRGS